MSCFFLYVPVDLPFIRPFVGRAAAEEILVEEQQCVDLGLVHGDASVQQQPRMKFQVDRVPHRFIVAERVSQPLHAVPDGRMREWGFPR